MSQMELTLTKKKTNILKDLHWLDKIIQEQKYTSFKLSCYQKNAKHCFDFFFRKQI